MVQPHFLWILVFHHEHIFPYIQPGLSILLFKATVPSVIPFILFATAARCLSASPNMALSFNFARLEAAHLTHPAHASHVLQVPCSLCCRFCTIHPAQGKSTLLALWSALTLKSFKLGSLQLLQLLSTACIYSTLGADLGPLAF